MDFSTDAERRTVLLTRVVAAIIARDGQVLVAQRAVGKRYGGLWEFPGGKVEEGESDAAALSRELLEELGLCVTSVSAPVAEFHDTDSQLLIVFLSATVTGRPRCHEHTAVRWVSWAGLSFLPLAPADAHFVSVKKTFFKEKSGAE